MKKSAGMKEFELEKFEDDIELEEWDFEQEYVSVCKDPLSSGLEGMDDNLMRLYRRRVGKVISHLAEIGLPQPGEQFRLITRRVFNAVEFLQYIAAQEVITDLYLTIFSINFQAAQVLIELLDTGRIERAEILMSNLRNKAHREKEEILRRQMIAHPRIFLFYCSSHAKMMSCRTESGQYYTCEGSGNLAYNSRLEQYVIDNDRALFEFSRTWMREIREYLAGKKELEICSSPS